MKSNRAIFFAGLVIVLAALAAYSNTFRVPFLLDDIPSVLDNPSVLSLWPLSGPLTPPSEHGVTVSGRPLLNLSVALNYAISGRQVWSYHVVNLLIHAMAGLTLFGLVRRTLQCPLLQGKFSGHALPTAFCLALIWTLHPLQTEAVTYIVQRAESLMALFYLLALYAFVRSVDSTQPRAWLVVSIGACLLGTGCKEVIVTAPVVIFLYDRTFAAGSFGGAWRARRWYYVGLMATWLPLAWLVLSTGGNRGGTFVYTLESFRGYWLTQFEALTRYLQLSLWPQPLIFEYGLPKVDHFSSVLPQGIVVMGLLGATVWALWKRPVAGFLGASFFLILSPTSVVPGITQVIVEHRMYLPLAVLLVAVIGSLATWIGQRALVALVAVAFVAGWQTYRRNADYRDDLTLWSDTVAKCPTSARAQSWLGVVYFNRDQPAAALPYFEESYRLDPSSALVQYHIGLTLARLGKMDEAAIHLTESIRLEPSRSIVRAELAVVLATLKRPAEAMDHLEYALAARPERAEIFYSAGSVMTEIGRSTKAVEYYERSLGLSPNQANAHFNLGLLLVKLSRPAEALAHYAEAVRLQPDYGEARLNWGVLLAQNGRVEEGLTQLQEAVRLQPERAEGHANLGIVLALAERPEAAVASYETALRLRPDYAVAHYNLGNALLTLRRWAEAKRHFAEAARLVPDYGAARDMLERMKAMPDELTEDVHAR